MLRWTLTILGVLALYPMAAVQAASESEAPRDIVYTPAPPAPAAQTPEEAHAKSVGCVSCHTASDQKTMHASKAVVLGCTDCHGGDATVAVTPVLQKTDADYRKAMDSAHVQPRFPATWNYPASANPERTYTLLNRESPEFIRFVNPSDYRIAREACGACHLPVIQAAERSLMATGAMLWGGAAYNNGILPYKRYITGEAYTRDGLPAKVESVVPVDAKMKARGALEVLYPLPAWEVVPVADSFRVFEHGGRNIITQFAEVGLPNVTGQIQRLDEPGRPDIRQSNRGPGTGLRISVPVLNIHKTRLNDPFTWFLGTNDQPGDYRTSGCGSCHVVYANDRDPRHSSVYAKFGHAGRTATADPTISKDERGHPIAHQFTRAIPTSQCMICHMHQPNMFVNTFLGYTMWDYESDAPLMWPKEQKEASIAEQRAMLDRNPEGAVVRGLWGDTKFLENVWTDINPKTKDTKFADYHGHGWNFRAVFKRDRKGNLLDKDGKLIPNDAPDKFDRTVHMSSIHVDVGMQCVDCHFAQDNHGNGILHGQVADAVEIGCKDCHGTAKAYPTLRTSNVASVPGGRDLSLIRNPDGRRRFEWRDGALYQRSVLDPKLEWKMSLVKDTVDPKKPDYNPKAARAKLMSKGTSMLWGTGVKPNDLAHQDEEVACFTCHTSWTTACAGCHLPVEANWKTARHHFQGGETRNYASYNPQVARDDMFQLGKHQSSKGNITAPVRSSSALVLSSTNVNRERIYAQQPPIAASGYSSQAFAPHYPHTERKTETKTCTDCHLSVGNDNNAIMAQLLLLGTNFVNFVGLNAYVGEVGGLEAVRVTEWDEPQAVIGSYLHKHAYPANFAQHLAKGRKLDYEIHGQTEGGALTGCLQLRGEYLLAAQGAAGTTAYDVASIANKGISDRILRAPVSPLGQSLHIDSANATCVAFPTNQPVQPLRNEGDLMRVENQEQPFHLLYRYAFITDAEEGLIATEVDTLHDNEPRNNFLQRALTWNDGGVLDGARHITIAGTVFYIAADAGVVVLDMDKPLEPKLVAVIPLEDVRSTAVQFRYLFAVTKRGMQTIDVTLPTSPRLVEGALVPLEDAHRVYVARTYAYVAAGPEGLVIVDIEKPEKPTVYQRFDADGTMTDARDIVVGSTNASLFGYVADGTNGLKVLQLTSPESQPNFYGFSPAPKPELIATYATRGPALALSRGLERDRAVDETGHQMAVFGRLGSRPFNLTEMRELFLDEAMKPWFVTDDVRMQDRR
ncbi:MAG TPA: hypothetical protein VHL31_08885 [Geminicoccus sp.]|jgi:hypothetical protein|uniref:multiheme c-type cytochrome n=1 Tax=Geminicoccus sp. TaxID=2024832 RepID=UPI002E31B564|nr:hypothetical protein [Geminicoccus sp.]HEX2526402.1 hypothetical protein [Geminicoccus sp.]